MNMLENVMHLSSLLGFSPCVRVSLGFQLPRACCGIRGGRPVSHVCGFSPLRESMSAPAAKQTQCILY